MFFKIILLLYFKFACFTSLSIAGRNRGQRFNYIFKINLSIVLNVRIIRIDKYLPTNTSDLFRTFVPLIGSDTS